MKYQTAIIRHLISTISFRTAHALEGAPANFQSFQAGNLTRTPMELVKHINQLVERTIEAHGGQLDASEKCENLTWEESINCLFTRLTELDEVVAQAEGLQTTLTIQQILQGPLCDILTHIGQLAMLRRLFGHPVESVSFIKADIQTGRLTRSIQT